MSDGSENCDGLVETTIGRVTAVDKQLTYDEAAKYCRDHASQLLSVHDTTLMSQLSAYAGSCGGGYAKWKNWHAGLRLRKGHGSWSDGSLFSPYRQASLFKYFPSSYDLFNCKVVSFSSLKNGRLYLYENCHYINPSSVFRFFCTGELSAPTTTTSQEPTSTTTLATTTTTTTTTQEPTSTTTLATTTTTTTTTINIPDDDADDDWSVITTTTQLPRPTSTLLRVGNDTTNTTPEETLNSAYLLPVLLGLLGLIILVFCTYVWYRKRLNDRRREARKDAREEREMEALNR